MQTIPDGTRVRARRPNGDILEGNAMFYPYITCGEYYHILLDKPYKVVSPEVTGRQGTSGKTLRNKTVTDVTTHGLYHLSKLTIL